MFASCFDRFITFNTSPVYENTKRANYAKKLHHFRGQKVAVTKPNLMADIEGLSTLQ